MAGKGAGGFDSFDLHGYSSYHSGGPPTAASSNRNMTNERSRLVQIISTNIHKMTQNVELMNRHINQIGSPSETVELHDKLHQVQHYTNQLAKETNQCLKDLARIPVTGSPSEQREHRLQQERLVNSFTTALNTFQSAQRKQKDKEVMQRQRGHLGVGSGFGPNGTEKMDSDKLIALESTQQQQQQQLMDEEDDEEEELLREREQSLRKLESDIMDVNQIFKDLSVMIHEQSDVIDSIEANVERSAFNVERGTEQLLQARNYQSKIRRKKLCIAIVVIIIIAIIALIIGVSVNRS